MASDGYRETAPCGMTQPANVRVTLRTVDLAGGPGLDRACRDMLDRLGRRRGAAFILTADLGGKPRLLADGAPSPIGVSRSHGGGIGLLALAEDGEIGVDIEPPRPVDDIDGIARAHMTVAEREWLLRQPPLQRDAAFLRLWTLKEAVVKATGEGLSRPLASVAIAIGPWPSARLAFLDGDTRPWVLRSFALASGHVGALAVPGAGTVTLRGP